MRLAGGGTMDRDYRSGLLQASREMARMALKLEAATELARLLLRLEIEEIELYQGQQRITLAWHPSWSWGQMYDLARQLTQPEPEGDR